MDTYNWCPILVAIQVDVKVQPIWEYLETFGPNKDVCSFNYFSTVYSHPEGFEFLKKHSFDFKDINSLNSH